MTVGRSASLARWRRLILLAVLLAIGAAAADAAVPRSGARAEADLGCADNRGLAHFEADDRLVMTYFYYWYDEASLANPALTLRPPPGQPFDWRDPAWHELQLADMAEVGVDVALAAYWGDGEPWSLGGLEAMVSARESLLAADVRPPAIGLLLDTNLYATILPTRPELADLTSQEGIETFADLVHGFLDRIPVCHQARVGGRPLVFVWRADTEDGDAFTYDQRTLAGVEDLLAARLGVRPLLVFERTWIDHAQAAGTSFEPEARYGWGAALRGPRFEGRTVALGPGYDDRAIVERPGYLRDREGGQTYARDLRAAVLSGTPWLLLETWNELWEGTAIAETAEHGRESLEITRRYVELFHRLGAATARDGWFDLGTGQGAYLRRLADAPQEEGERVEVGGRLGARALYEEADGASYFHFAVDRRLGIGPSRRVTIEVEYFDEGVGNFYLQYDSDNPSAADEGRHAESRPVLYEDSRRWRTARFELPDASFRARQYGGYGDFRIRATATDDAPTHAFGRVSVTAAPAARAVPLRPESLAFVPVVTHEPLLLEWTEVRGAAGYAVEVGPLDAPELPPWHVTRFEHVRCDGSALAPAGMVRGLATEPSCALTRRAPADAAELGRVASGPYRWRVTPVDDYLRPIGEPSDWSYVVFTP